MNKSKNVWKRFLPLWLTVLLIVSSCSGEQEVIPSIEKSDEVVFAIEVPASTRPLNTTKSIQEGSDNDTYVKQTDILLFDNSDELVRIIPVTNIVQSDEGNNRIKTVKAKLPQGEYKVVILANATEYLASSGVTTGSDKSTLQNIITAQGSFGAKWNSTPGSAGYKDFPMWGEVTGTVTIPRNPGDVVSADLYRMHAKVNVNISYATNNDFVLQSVSVYNYNKDGQLVPSPSAWGSNAVSERKTREASVSPTPLAYNNSFIVKNTTQQRYECVDEIFVFESAVTSGEWEWNKNTCIVIGGTYKGNPSYYRLDFIKEGTEIDIRRNHKYIFNIDNVTSGGYTDEESALKNRPENIIYNIISWDESISYVEFNGQYYIGISGRKTHFTQFANPNEYIYDVESNVPNLTLADFMDQTAGASDGSWSMISANHYSNGHFSVKLIPNPGKGSEYYLLTVSAVATISGDPARNTIYYLKGANLTAKLTITQDLHMVYKLNCSPDPQNAIMLDGEAQRTKIAVESTHDYTFAFADPTGVMITGIYLTPSGGSPLTAGTPIPPTQKEVWIEVSAFASVDPRVASVELKHTEALSDAPGVNYNILQVKPMLTANIKDGGVSGEINMDGGSIQIEVISNLTRWIAMLWIDGVAIEESQITNYLDRVTGSGRMIVTLTMDQLTTMVDKEIKVKFRNETGSVQSFDIVIIQTAYPYGGLSHRITLEGSGDNAKLVLTQDPTDAGLYFQFGSIFGIYSAQGTNQLLPSNSNSSSNQYSLQQLAYNPTSSSPTLWGYMNSQADLNIDKSFHTIEKIRLGLGDPCRLVGYTALEVRESPAALDNGKWRLPTRVETEAFINNATTGNSWWSGASSPFSGVAGLEFSGKNGDVKNFLPAAGARNNANAIGSPPNGYIFNQGIGGYYWVQDSGIALEFTNSSIYFVNKPDNYRSMAGSIRCVKQ